MFSWATGSLERLSQTMAPVADDPISKFVYACQQGDEEGAMQLVPQLGGAGVICNAAKQQCPIHLACLNTLPNLTRLLLTQPGASIEQVDADGNTGLHCASMSPKPNALELVQMLISDIQANVTAKNHKGQTPYDVSRISSVRQYLLPVQLQKETREALDNGGQGLPPGIDLGGMRIKNSTLAPPPMMGGGMGGGPPPPMGGMTGPPPPGATGGPPPMGAQPSPMGGGGAPPSPAVNMTPPPMMSGGGGAAGTPGAAQRGRASSSDGMMEHQPAPTSGNNNTRPQIAPAPASAAAASHGYARVGSSSAAIYKPAAGSSRHRSFVQPDGFHSSSSDKRLQDKYGHSSSSNLSGAAAVPPPPSSGNAVTPARSMSTGNMMSGSSAPPSFGASGANPYASGISNLTARGSARYVSYDPITGKQTSAAPPPRSASFGVNPSYPATPNVNVFTPPGAGGAQQQQQQTPYPGQQQQQPAPGTVAQAPASGGVPPNASSFVASPMRSQQPNTTSASATPTATTPTQQPAAAMFSTPTVNVVGASSMTTTSPNAAAATSPSMGTPSQQTPSSSPSQDRTMAPKEGSSWTQLLDPNTSRVYYFNAETGETSWELPQEEAAATTTISTPVPKEEAENNSATPTKEDNMMNETTPSTAEQQLLPTGWAQLTDPASSRVYYYNATTGETSWEIPQTVGDKANTETTATATEEAAQIAASPQREQQQPAAAASTFGSPQPAASPMANAFTTSQPNQQQVLPAAPRSCNAAEAFGAPPPEQQQAAATETIAISTAPRSNDGTSSIPSATPGSIAKAPGSGDGMPLDFSGGRMGSNRSAADAFSAPPGATADAAPSNDSIASDGVAEPTATNQVGAENNATTAAGAFGTPPVGLAQGTAPAMPAVSPIRGVPRVSSGAVDLFSKPAGGSSSASAAFSSAPTQTEQPKEPETTAAEENTATQQETAKPADTIPEQKPEVPQQQPPSRSWSVDSAESASDLFSKPAGASASGAVASTPAAQAADPAPAANAAPAAQAAAAAPAVSVPVAAEAPAPAPAADEEEEDPDEMDEIPLSPDVSQRSHKSPQQQSSAAADPSATDLFSAIGMPPPPFQKK